MKMITIKFDDADVAAIRNYMKENDTKEVSAAIRNLVRQALANHDNGLRFCLGKWVSINEFEETVLERAKLHPKWLHSETNLTEIAHNDKIVSEIRKQLREVICFG